MSAEELETRVSTFIVSSSLPLVASQTRIAIYLEAASWLCSANLHVGRKRASHAARGVAADAHGIALALIRIGPQARVHAFPHA